MADVDACPVDLITLHDTKNKYSKSLQLYTACSSQRILTPFQHMILGENIFHRFVNNYPERFQEIISKRYDFPEREGYFAISVEDNIDVIIAAIIAQTVEFEKKAGMKTSSEIKQDVSKNMISAFDMFVYDCVFGNNDRHSQNWAMYTDEEEGAIRMYPLYDNERVLGLSKPEAEVKRDVNSDDLIEKIDKYALSRMGISPIHSGLSYKMVLEHLTQKYPEFAIPAIRKITNNVRVDFIEELYDSAKGIIERSEDRNELTENEELPEEYRIYGTTLYSERREFAKKLLERPSPNKTHDTEIVLEA